ncbi:MAG: hypothetical protein V3R82_00365 [Candidatus Hydrothermarchaeales archaeon]
MKGSLIILGVVLFVLISSGCIAQTETQKTETLYVCPSGETVSDPNLCPEISTPTPTTPASTSSTSNIKTTTPPHTTTAPIPEMVVEEGKLSADKPAVEPHETSNVEEGKDPAVERATQGEDCGDDGPDKFNYLPADLDKVAFIKPMGMVQSEHVAPTDHIYLWTYQDSGAVDVYSPAGGVVTNIQHMGSFRGDNDYQMNDFYVNIRHGCGLDSIFIHIDSLSLKLSKVAPVDGGFVFVDVPVEAGEVIGTYSGSLDYMVVDKSVLLDFVDLESYRTDYSDDYHSRVHISDPIAYFSDSSRLIEKSLRTAEPIGGLLDYDVDGRLVGTWFKEDTRGWSGVTPERYWDGHLAIIYDAIDPEHVIVSTGDFGGRTGQFGVKGNSPDPGAVGVGVLVKYDLLGYAYFEGDKRWDSKSLVNGLKLKNDESDYRGIVLFELVEDRKLRVEFFPDKTSSQVSGFSDNTVIYER